ncbi:MAG: LysR family transcriptional regulator [Alphaproteobacteria bacterium]|nr:LysR family transcriptional regulator [Alphaproteobacteria bacterium]
MRRLPSLNGLRAFEAAARHGSFTAAGDELGVSQAAVSRLVRLLEARLKVPLFERRANGLELTVQGRAYQPGLTAAFDGIARLTEQVTQARNDRVLTVGVGPTFAIRWLIPRLGDFHRAHPDIEVRLTTGGAVVSLRDDWTCGVQLGDGDWPGYVAEPLFSAEMFPVCTPALAKKFKSPADLAGPMLLDVTHSTEDWTQWLIAAGRETLTARGPSFGTYAMALQAALDGGGVAMGLKPYVVDDLYAKRLVRPFELAVPKRRAWYIAYRSERAKEAGLMAFRTWLHEVARGR